MRSETAAALHRINREFYRRRALEFAATRRRPWSGWGRALEVFRRRAVPARAKRDARVFDAGCGNGRFAAYLVDSGAARWRYLGLDASPGLLAEARRTLGDADRFLLVAADLLELGWPLAEEAWRADWVVAFGVFHHVAGRENRRRLMRRLSRRVAPGGLLTVSFWQFGTVTRFTRRSIDWSEHLRRNGPCLDPLDLEPGDHLLAWGEGSDYRFCHHVDEAEAERLVESSGLEVLDRYRADGAGRDLNLYALLTR